MVPGLYIASKLKRITFKRVILTIEGPLKALVVFIERETLPSLLSTGWFQELIRACLTRTYAKQMCVSQSNSNHLV